MKLAKRNALYVRPTLEQVNRLGLDRWDLRFEPRTLPVTFSLTPSGHFFVRLVLGYASHNSTRWRYIEGAKQLAKQVFERRYPGIADIGLSYGSHGVTGHTALMRPVAGGLLPEPYAQAVYVANDAGLSAPPPSSTIP